MRCMKFTAHKEWRSVYSSIIPIPSQISPRFRYPSKTAEVFLIHRQTPYLYTVRSITCRLVHAKMLCVLRHLYILPGSRGNAPCTSYVNSLTLPHSRSRSTFFGQSGQRERSERQPVNIPAKNKTRFNHQQLPIIY